MKTGVGSIAVTWKETQVNNPVLTFTQQCTILHRLCTFYTDYVLKLTEIDVMTLTKKSNQDPTQFYSKITMYKGQSKCDAS